MPGIESEPRTELLKSIKVACAAEIEVLKHSNIGDFHQEIFWETHHSVSLLQ
jgi:hypothetical protein